MNVFNITFHGIGQPQRPFDPGEVRVWVSRDTLHRVLDIVRPLPDTRITFDDGNLSDFETALPALQERGLRATFFVVAHRIGQPCFLGTHELKILLKAGMAIGSHGMRHQQWRGLNEITLKDEVVGAKNILERVLGQSVTEAACPYGSYGRRALRALHDAGFTRVYTSDGGWARDKDWLQARNTIHCDSGGADPFFAARYKQSSIVSFMQKAKLAVKMWR